MDVSQKKWFTLVELVVVVVILWVLAAIGLVSYTSYLWGSRDSNRLTQLSDIRSWLNVYGINSRFPAPEDSVNILANGNVIATQGYAGEKTLNLIGYSDGGKDPLDKGYFTYYLTKDKRDFQLMTFLEEENILAFSPITQTHATDIDYSERIPAVTGKKLWTLVEWLTNTPVQEVDDIVAIGDIDIATTGIVYDAYYEDDNILSGTGGVLIEIVPNRNCERILEVGNNAWSGIYRISPTGAGDTQVYCDMETDGGGWTRVVYAGNGDTLWNAYDTDETLTNSATKAIFGMRINQFSNDVDGEDIEYMLYVDGVQTWPIYSDVHKDALNANLWAGSFDDSLGIKNIWDSTPDVCEENIWRNNSSWNWSFSFASSGCSWFNTWPWFIANGGSNAFNTLYGLDTYNADTDFSNIEIWIR